MEVRWIDIYRYKHRTNERTNERMNECMHEWIVDSSDWPLIDFIHYISNPYERDSANACPHYQKLCARATPIWGSRRSQPMRSAMHRPRPGGTAFLITVSPAPGKYENSFTAASLSMRKSLATFMQNGIYINSAVLHFGQLLLRCYWHSYTKWESSCILHNSAITFSTGIFVLRLHLWIFPFTFIATSDIFFRYTKNRLTSATYTT